MGTASQDIASSGIELQPQYLTLFDIISILEGTEDATVDSNYPTILLGLYKLFKLY